MTTYQELHRQIENLTPDEQLRLLGEIASIVRYRVSPKPKCNITELEGLGKEIWQGVDAQDYIVLETRASKIQHF